MILWASSLILRWFFFRVHLNILIFHEFHYKMFNFMVKYLYYFLKNARHITWFVSVMLFSAFNFQEKTGLTSWDFRSCTTFRCLFLVFSTSPYVYKHLFTTTVELASMNYWNHHFQESISCRGSQRCLLRMCHFDIEIILSWTYLRLRESGGAFTSPLTA